MDIMDELVKHSGSVVLTVICVLVFLFSAAALAGMRVTGIPRWIIAACVAALSVLGILQLAPGPATRHDGIPDGSLLNGILLPYAALGLTIPLLFILFLLDRFGKWIEQRRLRSEQRKKVIEHYVAKDVLRPRDKGHGEFLPQRNREFCPNKAVGSKPLREAGEKDLKAPQTRQH